MFRAIPAFVIALLVLSAACGGGGEEPAASDTPEATASPAPTEEATPSPIETPSPEATPSPEPPPEAPSIKLAPGQVSLGEGSSERTLGPGEIISLDARDFALELGVSITSCIDTSLYFTWQVRDPYPPDGVDLEFYRLLRGSRELRAEGAFGELTDGACAAMEMVNNSAFAITVQLRYAFAE